VENATRRPREYLTVKEVTKLINGARERSRYGHRDATMILVAYRHGLRVSELCALRWDQVDCSREQGGSEFPFPVHPHMLRHACGYKLANDGQDARALQHYLGHKNIQHTVRYTELSPERVRSFWED
jgi:type 1 fimbriae regulatory protein FimB/type 1 fimbriae regulatory protein FimE